MSATIDSLTILRDTHFIFEKKLGEGSSGIVVLAKTKASSKDTFRESQSQFVYRAIKTFAPKHACYYRREKKALKLLSGCENIVQMDKAVSGANQSYIIMEQCQGDLAELIHKKKYIRNQDAKEMFLQMVRGLLECHGRGVCHHDVKLDNFLIGKDGQIKLSDFGYSILLDDEEWIAELEDGHIIKGQYSAGSPAYSSPQVLNKEAHSPVSNDIYGLGICLYRMVCGLFPFCNPDVDLLSVLKRNVERSKDQSTIYFPQHVTDEMKEIICGMIAYNEEDRWNWADMAVCDWLSQE